MAVKFKNSILRSYDRASSIVWPCIMHRVIVHRVTVHHAPCDRASCDRAPSIVTNFFTIKTNRRTNFQIYSGTKLYMFRAVSLPILRIYVLYIRHWHMLCSFDDSLRAGSRWNCSSILILPNVQWITPDDGQRKCLKHVEFVPE